MDALYFSIACGAVAVAYGIWAIRSVMAASPGNERMQQIAGAVQEGAKAYLNRQYMTVALVGVVIAVILLVVLGLVQAVGFVIGAVLSGLAGYIGMLVSVRANVRTAEAARSSLEGALDVAVKAGAVTGILVVGLGLLGVAVYYLVLLGAGVDQRETIEALVALGFGGSLISIFARLGGGIFTKGADVGADLVGKVEAGIPEDDPRNPAVIADNVGDNVGDCAGMAADLFETYAVTFVATILLASIFFQGETQASMMVFPLVLGGVCILGTVIGSFFMKLGSGRNIMRALYKGFLATAVISAALFIPVTEWVVGLDSEFSVGTQTFNGWDMFLVRPSRPRDHRPADRHHRVLHVDRVPPGAGDRPRLGDRSRHEHHPGPRPVDGSDRRAGDRDRRRHHRRLSRGRAVRHRRHGHDDAGARGRGRHA